MPGWEAPKILLEPIRLPVAVHASDLHLIAADLVFQGDPEPGR
jgi:hypothetical protein